MYFRLNLCFFEYSWKFCRGFGYFLFLVKFLICYCSEFVINYFFLFLRFYFRGFYFSVYGVRVILGIGMGVVENKMLRIVCCIWFII